MSFLDGLLGGKKPRGSERDSEAAVPDFPVPFGYKTSWLCVKSNFPEEVISALGLKAPVPSGWEKGIASGVFVSPVLDGYVLAINYGDDIITEDLDRLNAIAKRFPEVQYFSSHRVADYAAWVKYVGGEMVRGYCWCGGEGELYLNVGEMTAEEEAVLPDNLLQSSDDDWETAEFADEENVLDIAAAWGIDPRFSDEKYPKSTGWVCGR